MTLQKLLVLIARKVLMDGFKENGDYSVDFNADQFPTGTIFYVKKLRCFNRVSIFGS